MTPRDLSQRELHRFTGPPENWLTAIKFMTWGLEGKHLDYWQKIEPGDIFMMHSTSTNTMVKNARSSVIGFGVVSPEFNRKSSLLWLKEIEKKQNIWPLLVPFSEVYLFSQLRQPELLQAPDGHNAEIIISEVGELLSNSVPLPEGFPWMGSFSSVKPEVVVKIFSQAARFYLYNSNQNVRESYGKTTPLKKVSDPQDVVRKPVSLETMNIVKQKTMKVGSTTFARDPLLLEKAEENHFKTLSRLFEYMKSRGYELYYNRHIDLFASNNEKSFLFEVKSINRKNFRSQSRSGIVQLFEYDYFEIKNYMNEKGINTSSNKALIYSDSPKDLNYIEFMNNLKLGAGYFKENKLQAIGQGALLQI